MATKYSESFKTQTVKRYDAGESIQSLHQELGIAESILYRWIQTHKSYQSSEGAFTPKDYEKLAKTTLQLQNIIEIIQLSGLLNEVPLRRKLEILDHLHKQYPQYRVYELREALSVAKGTFYNHIFRRADQSKKEAEKYALMQKIQEIFDASGQRYGIQKIHAVLKQEGLHISNKRIGTLMREMGLQSIRTDAKKQYIIREKRIRQNHLRRNFTVDTPNKIWVSDITSFKIKGIWIYLCVIIDLYSRKVVGYHISKNSSTQFLTKAFKNAYTQRGQLQGLTFHSDQGSQYTSQAFTKLLRNHNILQSFSQPGNPLDNAVSETFFASFKKEEAYRRNYTSERHFISSVATYIDFFNDVRPHETLNYKTPTAFEHKFQK